MISHSFIFHPGIWEGEGTISLSMADDILEFSTTWIVLPLEDGKIYFDQIVEIQNFAEKSHNHFTISLITKENFEISLENRIVGCVRGKGILSPHVIAWEFSRTDQEFEGFEMYELQIDGSYKMRAEFTAGEGFRTQIQGYIEKK